MAVPVALMVGIAAASTIAQFINSERGRELTRKERKRLEKLIDKLEAPQFDTSMLTPPELKVLETYTPEVAEMVYEVDPELIDADSDRAIAGKAAQDAALSQFQAIASGQDPLGDVAIVKAINDAIESSGAQRQAILADMARKGVSPSSSAFAQLQFGQEAQSQKNMFDASLNAALAERARRDRALGQSAELGGRILGFETDLEARNANIINELNRRNTQARRQYLTNKANALNEAQRYNQEQRQRLYEANALGRYNAQREARDLKNRQVEALYRTERDKLGMKTGNARFGDIAETTQGRNQAIQGLSDAAIMGAMLSGKQSSQPPVQQVNQVDQQGYPSYIRPSEEIPLR